VLRGTTRAENPGGGARRLRQPAVDRQPVTRPAPRIGDLIERKITGISIYESQIDRLFDDKREVAKAVRAYGNSLWDRGRP
jgi:hypothetical protein